MNKKPLYIFLHMAKCGGTTMKTHIHKSFSDESILVVYHEPVMKMANEVQINFNNADRNNTAKIMTIVEKYITSLPDHKKDSIDIIIGHYVHYGIHHLFPGREVRYITMARKPLDTLISQYNYGIMVGMGLVDIVPDNIRKRRARFLIWKKQPKEPMYPVLSVWVIPVGQPMENPITPMHIRT